MNLLYLIILSIIPPRGVEPPPEAPPPVPPQRPRVSPRLLIRYGAMLGALMILIAWLWSGVLRGESLGDWFPGERWMLYLLAGAAVGSGFAALAWRLLSYIPSLKRLELLLLHTIDMRALGYPQAALLGLVAGVPEEILFRGTLQPVLGWALTSIIFGVLHAITLSYFVYATVAGALLGGLAIWSGGLWAPIAAHTVIDVIMFALLIRKWRRAQSPG
jgi:membrane protease YdiL (CAAX protease family)